MILLGIRTTTIRPASSLANSATAGEAPVQFSMLVISSVAVVVLITLAIFGIVTLITGFINRCPKCGVWWVKRFLGKQLIERIQCYGLVTRTAHTHTSGSYSGSSSGSGFHHGSTSSSGTTRWKERVPVVRSTYQHHYCCKVCNHRWTRTEVVEVEDFGRG
jgi:hypothetical protein